MINSIHPDTITRVTGNYLYWKYNVAAPATYFKGFDSNGFAQQNGMSFAPEPSPENYGTDPIKVTQTVQGLTVRFGSNRVI